MIALAAIFCLIAGGLLGLAGSLGLLRLPGAMARLHGPVKATVPGTLLVLVAALLRGWERGDFPPAALLIGLFLLLTAPAVVLLLARAHLARRPPEGVSAASRPGS